MTPGIATQAPRGRLADREALTLVAVNVIGGLLVLGSYVFGFVARPDAMGALWGGVPETLRPLYTANMFLAAGGYFLFTHYFVFRLSADTTVAGVAATRLVTALYLLVLIPSALWLPVTVAIVDQPSVWLWLLIRLDLALVGVASLGLLVSAVIARPRARGRTAAIVGTIPFSVQTALLDATIWPIYFPAP